MTITRRNFVGAIPILAVAARSGALSQMLPADDHPWELWYRQPANRWLDALPLGNGRLGAMVFGSVGQEMLRLNESTVWSGSANKSNINPAAREYLGEMRQLLFDGKYAEGNALCAKYLCGREDSYGTHLPMANLLIDHGNTGAVENYRRWLDLQAGLAGVEYSIDGVQFRREIFISNPDQVLVVRFTANRPGQLSFVVSLDPGDLPGEVRAQDNQTLALMGSAWEKKHSDGKLGVNFQAVLRVVTDGGRTAAKHSNLEIIEANAVTMLVAANTNYGGADFASLNGRQLKAASDKSYGELRARHIADHRRLFDRVSIDLGGNNAAHKPTDERLAAIQKGAADPQLSALFFQYGRYLTIAGSRENSPLPMNLQGIWNDNLAANMVWTCDFHLDINTQQNYWPSESCNLSECGEPLFKLVETIAQHGRATAASMYGARGWVCHVYTNAWGFTAPGVGMQWGPFVTGGIWSASHLWEHYRFTRDRVFLEKRAYPVLRSAAEFFLDYMVQHPHHHWLVTGPSISAENVFLSPEGQRCFASMGPTCDRVLVHGLFTSCIQAAQDLNIDAEFRARVEVALAKLPPLQIGKHGQLQEWLEDFDEGEPNHRHTSHLIALFPLDQITPDQTPELAQAALVTLQRRLGQKDWQDVEWSRANLIHFFARLRDGDAAHRHLLGLLQQDTDHNLMTFSRAGIAGAVENIFAIDGNTAASSGVAEMLLQSHAEIHLLPALPKDWPEGSIKGLRARGGLEVDVEWKSGVLTSATLRSSHDLNSTMRYGDKVVAVNLKAGESARFGQNLARIRS